MESGVYDAKMKNMTPEQKDDFMELANKQTVKNTVAKVKIIYQSIEDLHASCPNHQGDWYFTGNYPTPGGNKVVNQAYINYYNGINERAY